MSSAFGTDIWVRPASQSGPRFETTPAGDLLTVTGHDALEQSLFRRWTTNKGEWKTKPNYGGNLRTALKAKLTQSRIDRLCADLKEQALQDARVKDVLAIKVERVEAGIRLFVKILTAFDDSTLVIDRTFS